MHTGSRRWIETLERRNVFTRLGQQRGKKMRCVGLKPDSSVITTSPRPSKRISLPGLLRVVEPHLHREWLLHVLEVPADTAILLSGQQA